MISWLTFIPLLATMVVMVAPTHTARRWALLAATLDLWLVLAMARQFVPGGDLQFVERYQWIPSLGVEYLVGIDGLNLLVLILTALLGLLALWMPGPKERTKLYYSLVLAQLTGLYGAFTALNFFHWFLYWEASLVPAFLLIKFFGGERRHDAALRFFIYTAAGSLPMLLGFLYLQTKAQTFDLTELAKLGQSGAITGQLGTMYPWVFWAVFAAFWVKTPLVPLHLWQADAYTEAPAPVSVLLTGVLSKLGLYGMLRVLLPIFPEGLNHYAPWLLGITVTTILWGAWGAVRQQDLKMMLTYSSLNHVAYGVLGVVVAGMISPVATHGAKAFALQGAILQMFTHGIIAGALFYMVAQLEERTGTRFRCDLKGLRAVLPRFCGGFGFLIFASMGLPFLAGFVSEFLIFRGAFALAPVFTSVAAMALGVTAMFFLTLIQESFWGETPARWQRLKDLQPREGIILAGLAGLILWVGIWPAPFLQWSQLTVLKLVGAGN
jgi:NADH-quinone oxidoreductase subunit M